MMTVMERDMDMVVTSVVTSEDWSESTRERSSVEVSEMNSVYTRSEAGFMKVAEITNKV